MISLKTAHQRPSSHLLQSCLAMRGKLAEPATRFAVGERSCYQPKSQATRTGRVTQVPVKTEWRRKYAREGNCFFFCVDVRFLLLFDRQWSNLISDCYVLPISIPLIVSSKRGGCYAMFGVTYHIIYGYSRFFSCM